MHTMHNKIGKRTNMQIMGKILPSMQKYTK